MGGGGEFQLVGRDDELSAIRDRVARAASGTPEAILIEGEAGIGKTRLLREAARIARRSGFTIFHAIGDELEQPHPFGVLLEAFGEEIGLRPGAPIDRRLAATDDVLAFIERSSANGNVGLFIDDLHWCDQETVNVLRTVVRRAAGVPLVFVAAARPVPGNADLQSIVEAIEKADGLHLTLHGLDERAVASLLDQVLGQSARSDIGRLVAAAHGNPFFCIELASGGVDEGLKPDVRRTILRRITHLSEATLSVLRLASLLGPVIPPAELEAVTAKSALELVPILDEAIKSGVLLERTEEVAFRHDLVREAIYTDIPQALRRRLHLEAGHAIAAAGAPARRVAQHLAAGADAGDEEAISWLRRAAAEEMITAPGSAADLMKHAITLLDPADPRVDRFNADRARALAVAGRIAEAESVARDVLPRLGDPNLEGEVRAALGESLFFQGRLGEASNEMERAAEMSHERLRGLRLAEAALSAVASGQIDRGAEIAQRSIGIALEPAAVSLANGVMSLVATVRGQPDAIDFARRAVSVASADPSGQAHRYGAHVGLGIALHESDEFEDSVRVFNRGIELDRARGVAWATPIYHGGLALSHFYAGAWDDAVAELETAQQLLDEMSSLLFRPLFHGLSAAIAFHRGDLEAADREVSAGESHIAVTGPQIGFEWCVYSRAQLLSTRGEVTPAHAIVSGACHLARAAGFPMAFRYFGPIAVTLALGADDEQPASAVVADVEAFAERSPSPTAKGTALRCRGLLENDADALLSAVEVLRKGRRPFELAGACEEAGRSLLSKGDTQGAALLEEAAETFDRITARGDVERVMQMVNGKARAGTRRRPGRAGGWESLSPTERRVAALVAEGLTNAQIAQRLIVSRRTIETHVYHLFQKLTVSSRVELALKASKELDQTQVQ